MNKTAETIRERAIEFIGNIMAIEELTKRRKLLAELNKHVVLCKRAKDAVEKGAPAGWYAMSKYELAYKMLIDQITGFKIKAMAEDSKLKEAAPKVEKWLAAETRRNTVRYIPVTRLSTEDFEDFMDKNSKLYTALLRESAEHPSEPHHEFLWF